MPNAIVASGEVLVLVVGNVSGLAWLRTDSLGQKSIEFPLSQAPSAHGGVAIVPIRENVRRDTQVRRLSFEAEGNPNSVCGPPFCLGPPLWLTRASCHMRD